MISGVFSIPLQTPGGAAKSPGAKARANRQALPEFIGGEENLLARAAAQTLLSSSSQFNPLVFVGPTGVGKTHLAHGLAERWKQSHPEGRAILTTGSDFARAYAEAVETDSLTDLREKYHAADLLFVDDVHELAGKRPAQQELVYLLDVLAADEKRILVTARQLPTEIPHLAEGLAGRLSAGLCVPLAAPGTLARRAILVKLAALHELPLATHTIEKLVTRLLGTVPELQHAVVELQHVSRHTKQSLSETAVDGFLDRQLSEDQISLRTISTTTAKYFRLKTADLKGPSRRTGVVQARSVAMYLARQLTSESLEQVGEHFGGRDHTTVLHACRKTESLLTSDEDTKHMIEELMQLISTTRSS